MTKVCSVESGCFMAVAGMEWNNHPSFPLSLKTDLVVFGQFSNELFVQRLHESCIRHRHPNRGKGALEFPRGFHRRQEASSQVQDRNLV